MNIQPLRDNVLISPDKELDKEKTDTGIYLPESSDNSGEKPQMGKVLEIGESEEIKVKKGQRVIYNKYSGTEISVEGEELLIVKNEDVLAIIEK